MTDPVQCYQQSPYQLLLRDIASLSPRPKLLPMKPHRGPNDGKLISVLDVVMDSSVWYYNTLFP